MNFHWRLFQKPQPLLDTLPMRSDNGQFAPSPTTRRQRQKQDEVTAELRRYVTEQRLLEAVAKAVMQ